MDNSRRTFLKIVLFGGGTFVAGRLLGPFLSKFADETLPESGQSIFKVVENDKILSIFDNSGEEVLQIDKSDDKG